MLKNSKLQVKVKGLEGIFTVEQSKIQEGILLEKNTYYATNCTYEKYISNNYEEDITFDEYVEMFYRMKLISGDYTLKELLEAVEGYMYIVEFDSEEPVKVRSFYKDFDKIEFIEIDKKRYIIDEYLE